MREYNDHLFGRGLVGQKLTYNVSSGKIVKIKTYLYFVLQTKNWYNNHERK